MKRFISIIGIIFLAIVIIINLVYTAYLDVNECPQITFNSISYILGLITLSLFIFLITKLVNLHLFENDNIKKKKVRIILFSTFLLIYFLFNAFWIIFINPAIVGDLGHVCDVADIFSEGNDMGLSTPTYAGISLREYLRCIPSTNIYLFCL